MDSYFKKLNEMLFNELLNSEILKTGMWGENSQFIRLNNSKIRQTGIVKDLSFSMSLISNERQVSLSRTITGNYEEDAIVLQSNLKELRRDINEIL